MLYLIWNATLIMRTRHLFTTKNGRNPRHTILISVRQNILEMTENLNSIVLVLIICRYTCFHSFIYLLININERSRELATINCWLYDKELLYKPWKYRLGLYRNAIGIFPMCYYCCGYYYQVDIVMFNRVIKWQSFLYSGLLTMLFTFIVNFILH